MTHTPGPWYVLSGTIIRSKDRGFIASTPAANIPTFEEDRANARLIAAAPDLLEALKLVHHAWRGDYDMAQAMKTVKQAIARAEDGKQ